MSLSLLNPVFLFGLLGLAVPVVIHLLTRRQQKTIRFSAVHLLLQSQKRSVKRAAPNRLLLLLVRCLAVAVLSLALASPIFSLGSAESLLDAGPRATVFVLDDSYSMSWKAGEGHVFERAVETLQSEVAALPAGSVYSLVLASSPARTLIEWTGEKERAEHLLKSAKAGPRTTRIDEALALAAALIESAPLKKRRLVLLGDMDQNGWDGESFSAAMERYPARVKIIDFSGLRTGENRAALDAIEVSQEFLTHSRVVRVKTRAINLSTREAVSRLPITLWLGEKKQSEGFIDIDPAGKAEKTFSFPLEGSEALEGRVTLGEDALSADNTRYFTFLPDRNIRVLAVDGDPKTVAHQSETFYLERALNPFSVALSNIEPTVATLSELAVANLFDYSVVLLANVRELPVGYELELEKFVMQGGALFISLGDQVDPKYYNERLGNLLPVSLDALKVAGRGEAPYTLSVQGNPHPVLDIFKPREIADMENVPFRALYTVVPREGAAMETALSFKNGYPAVIEASPGRGKVVLFVTSVDRDWNDFPIQPTFLPWVQRWIKYSAKSLESIQRQDLKVGEPFTWSEDRAWVRSPGGHYLPMTPEGEGFVYQETRTPGVYRLFRAASDEDQKTLLGQAAERALLALPEDAKPQGAFTVNVDLKESAPGKLNPEDLQERFPNFIFEWASPEENEQGAPSSGFPLATPLLLLMAGFLLFEGFLVRRE